MLDTLICKLTDLIRHNKRLLMKVQLLDVVDSHVDKFNEFELTRE